VTVLALPALALPLLTRWQFNVLSVFHAALYGYLFFCAWWVLRTARPSARGRAGLLVLKTALAVLAAMYFLYTPIFAATSIGWLSADPPFLDFSPFYDMLLLTLLGFGIVMVTSGDVQSDLELARDRLAGVAQKDHLTSAFNRHAFYGLVDRDLPGTAVFADIDNLKSINDQFGHAAGDQAIRACASSIRAHIRADDLLFRWGGDEFLVLLLGVSEADARKRLAGVNNELRDVRGGAHEGGMTVSVSMGFAPFNSVESLDEVIRVADTAMYGTKRRTPGDATLAGR
jgi:diguanylate cyclase (GGDEF)-like protein